MSAAPDTTRLKIPYAHQSAQRGDSTKLRCLPGCNDSCGLSTSSSEAWTSLLDSILRFADRIRRYFWKEHSRV